MSSDDLNGPGGIEYPAELHETKTIFELQQSLYQRKYQHGVPQVPVDVSLTSMRSGEAEKCK
jgi:hypothetical protein